MGGLQEAVCITLRIQILHSEYNFVTLKSCKSLSPLNMQWYPLSWWTGGENIPSKIQEGKKVPPWKRENWEPWHMRWSWKQVSNLINHIQLNAKVITGQNILKYSTSRSLVHRSGYTTLFLKKMGTNEDEGTGKGQIGNAEFLAVGETCKATKRENPRQPWITNGRWS